MKASTETGALRIMAVTTKQNTPEFDEVYQQERAHLDTRLRTETTAQDAPSRSRSRQRASRSPSQGPEAGGAGGAGAARRVASPSRVKGSVPFAHLGRYVRCRKRCCVSCPEPVLARFLSSVFQAHQFSLTKPECRAKSTTGAAMLGTWHISGRGPPTRKRCTSCTTVTSGTRSIPCASEAPGASMSMAIAKTSTEVMGEGRRRLSGTARQPVTAAWA